MATKSELWTQLANMIKLCDETYKFGADNTPNFVTLYSTLQGSFKGNHTAATQASITNMRDALNSAYSNGVNGVESLILELAKVGYNSIATTVQEAIDDIFRGMTSASETIQSRAYTYASSATAGGSNVGTGTVYRNTEDINGQDIESGYINAGTVNLDCEDDKNTGRPFGQERFKIYGSGITPVDIIEQNTARPESLIVTAKRSISSTILKNASFESENGETGSDFAVTNWTLDTPANFSINTGTTPNDRFRPADIVTNSGNSLDFNDNGYISQWIAAEGKSFELGKNYIFVVRYRTEGTVSTGTLTITLGTKTATANLAGGVASWTELKIGADEDGYYDNFKDDDSNKGVLVKIAITSLTGTNPVFRCDSLILEPLDVFDGCGYIVLAGATDFLRGDTFSYSSDTVLNTGRMQLNLARFEGRHLPHTTGTPTYPDA